MFSFVHWTAKVTVDVVKVYLISSFPILKKSSAMHRSRAGHFIEITVHAGGEAVERVRRVLPPTNQEAEVEVGHCLVGRNGCTPCSPPFNFNIEPSPLLSSAGTRWNFYMKKKRVVFLVSIAHEMMEMIRCKGKMLSLKIEKFACFRDMWHHLIFFRQFIFLYSYRLRF